MKPSTILRAAVLSIAPVALSPAVRADVPPDIAKALVAVGRGVCVNETAQLYRPLHANPPYPGVSISRDLSFGSDPKNVVDVYSAEKGGGSRPVLLFLPGGAGNRSLPGANGEVFYGNIMVWAVKNGMTGVIMQRRPGDAWDDPAKDVAKAVQWVGDNIGKYNGGQKVLFFAVSLLAVLLLLTGLVLWFPLSFPAGLREMSWGLHDAAFLVFAVTIVVHIYLGTAALPGTFQSMTRGTVSKAWARLHHPRWYREVTGDRDHR